ncbi:hypothetical protein E2C01_097096 [Portunus trituberculatus]|uniref:Uncharacterized protein n=1 Tax=Portunus trituberculatus TaxID=210409 RepID=A0A5B7JUA1_PORTR|nr:hypothetical protein [Portunus trituberculatus]
MVVVVVVARRERWPLLPYLPPSLRRRTSVASNAAAPGRLFQGVVWAGGWGAGEEGGRKIEGRGAD